ncbi:hypothetical protein U3516DRAFT_807266 [Neocallimastix sp. 'constans']
MINNKKYESSDNTFYYNPNIEEKNYPYIESLSKFDANNNFNDDLKTPKTKNTVLEPSEIKYNNVLFKMKKKAVTSSNNSSNNNGKNSIDLINDSTDELKGKIKTMCIKENNNAIDIINKFEDYYSTIAISGLNKNGRPLLLKVFNRDSNGKKIQFRNSYTAETTSTTDAHDLPLKHKEYDETLSTVSEGKEAMIKGATQLIDNKSSSESVNELMKMDEEQLSETLLEDISNSMSNPDQNIQENEKIMKK